jgi:hypothetical protein
MTPMTQRSDDLPVSLAQYEIESRPLVRRGVRNLSLMLFALTALLYGAMWIFLQSIG